MNHHHFNNILSNRFSSLQISDQLPALAKSEIAENEIELEWSAERQLKLQNSGVYIPDHYEPGYAYPLVIWFHETGGSEQSLYSLMPEMSERNHFGLSFRGGLPAINHLPGTYRWPKSEKQFELLEQKIYDAVVTLRREFHIHSERIYLAGFGEGGTLAMKLLFSQPERYAGAASLSGQFATQNNPLKNLSLLRGKRVFQGTGVKNAVVTPSDISHSTRLLHSAGLEAKSAYFESDSKLTPRMLSEIDRWILSGIPSSYLVK